MQEKNRTIHPSSKVTSHFILQKNTLLLRTLVILLVIIISFLAVIGLTSLGLVQVVSAEENNATSITPEPDSPSLSSALTETVVDMAVPDSQSKQEGAPIETSSSPISDTLYRTLAPPITPTVRPLGIVTDVIGPNTWPTTCANGLSCYYYDIEVDCTPYVLQPLRAELRVGDPTTGFNRGTIFIANGWTGDWWWEERVGAATILNTLRTIYGFRTVELKWYSPWLMASANEHAGFGKLACRSATAALWVDNNLVDRATDPNQPFCATGWSNGATQLAHTIAQYDLADNFSTVLFEGGPNVTRVDCVCIEDPAYPELGPNDPDNQTGLVDWSFGAYGFCAFQNQNLSYFQESSITYNNWDFFYPETMISFLTGEDDNTDTAIQGKIFYERLIGSNTPLIISSTIANTDHSVIATAQGATAFINTLADQCVPRPSTYHVANTTADCAGNIPCKTGVNGLDNAINALNVSRADGTIIIHGAYEINSKTPIDVDAGVDILIKGTGGTSSINSTIGACSNYMLTLSNSSGSVTIKDLVLDGDANCTGGSGPRNGIDIISGTGVITLQNLTLRDMGTGVRGADTFVNGGNTYDNNAIGIDIIGGASSILSDTFTNNNIAIRETSSGVVSIGTASNNGSTFTNNGTGIDSDGNAIIKGNLISGGTTGIKLSADASAIYGNHVTGASGEQIECSGTATSGAAFNYIGASATGVGSNCADNLNQLGAPFIDWTDNFILHEASSTTGPIFDLGSTTPFSNSPPIGVSSNYYAVMSGSVMITGTDIQFKMFMDGTGCNPMTGACWESTGNGRPQVGPGYFVRSILDPTAITLNNVSGSTETIPLILIFMVAILSISSLSLQALHRREHYYH